MADEPVLKPVIWLGSSRKDLRSFPEPVQDHMGMPCTLRSAAGKASRRENAERLWRSGRSGSGPRTFAVMRPLSLQRTLR